MSKKNTSTQRAPQKHDKPVAKATVKSPTAQKNAVNRGREAKDAKKFFIVLGVGTVLLVLFLYFIFVGRG